MTPTCPVCGCNDGFRVNQRNTHRAEVLCRNPECTFELAPAEEDLILAALTTYQRDHASRVAAENAVLFARAEAIKTQMGVR